MGHNTLCIHRKGEVNPKPESIQIVSSFKVTKGT